MTSGIYKLTFSNGQYYIGKSKDITRRWKEHGTKFEKGTAAKNMQACFNKYGHAEAEVLLECHPDHLDVIEPLAIHNNWGPSILNTTREVPDPDLKERDLPLCTYSLAQILEDLHVKAEIIENLEQKIEDITKGTELEKVQKELAAYKKLFSDKVDEINNINSRGWVARLFNTN